MFDQLLPPLYLQLRIKSGLSKTKLATRLGATRQTVARYESGATRPDAEWERRLIEAAECLPRDVAQMLCDLLGELIDRPVVILEPEEPEPEAPPSLLERTEATARELRHFLPATMYRALTNKIHITRMMELTLERQSADLEELATDCRATAGRHAPRRKAAHVPRLPNQGATGSSANGPVLDNRTDGTPPERSTPKPKHPPKGIKP